MTIAVTLSATLKEFVEAEAARQDYKDADRYIATLIAREFIKTERRELEASLLEGLTAEATEMTPEDWADIRREVMELIDKGMVHEG